MLSKMRRSVSTTTCVAAALFALSITAWADCLQPHYSTFHAGGAIYGPGGCHCENDTAYNGKCGPEGATQGCYLSTDPDYYTGTVYEKDPNTFTPCDEYGNCKGDVEQLPAFNAYPNGAYCY